MLIKDKYNWQIADEKRDRRKIALDAWKIETNFQESKWRWVFFWSLISVLVSATLSWNRFVNDSPTFGILLAALAFILAIIMIISVVNIEFETEKFDDSYVDIDPELEEWIVENL